MRSRLSPFPNCDDLIGKLARSLANMLNVGTLRVLWPDAILSIRQPNLLVLEIQFQENLCFAIERMNAWRDMVFAVCDEEHAVERVRAHKNSTAGTRTPASVPRRLPPPSIYAGKPHSS